MWCTDLDNRLAQSARYRFACAGDDLLLFFLMLLPHLLLLLLLMVTDSLSHRKQTHATMLIGSQPVDTNVSDYANAITPYTQFLEHSECVNSTLHFCKLPRVNALKILTI